MKKKKSENEINLVELINIIWPEKPKIILITLFTVIFLVFFSKTNIKVIEDSILAKTEITPISSFNDYKYSAYNTFLKFNNNSLSFSTKDKKIDVDNFFQPSSIKVNYAELLTTINSENLYDLFIEKLNNEELLIRGIKKNNLIHREDYEDNFQYINAIKDMASSIEIIKNTSEKTYIEFITNDKKKWGNFLIYLEKNANLEIRNYLINEFNSFLENSQKFSKYAIEDIQYEIENFEESKEITNQLKKLKKRTLENKNLTRLRDLFYNTPLIKSDNFYAGKINLISTDFENLNKKNTLSLRGLVILGLILGLILGIIFVIISNSLKKTFDFKSK